jgi:hypothetical protein
MSSAKRVASRRVPMPLLIASSIAICLLAVAGAAVAFQQREEESSSISNSNSPPPLVRVNAAAPAATPHKPDPATVDAKPDAPAKPAPVITAGHQRMLDALEEVRQHMGDNPFFPTNETEKIRAELSLLQPGINDSRRTEQLLKLAVHELKLGQETESIDHFLEAYKMLPEPRNDLNARTAAFWIGVAYLRFAETQNCCARNTPDSCLLPIRGQGIHTQREGSEAAIEYFSHVLQHEPAGSLNYNNALWLLNIAHMTLGDYPDGVPAQYRIPTTWLESEEPFPRFFNVASKAKLNPLNSAGGIIIDDFNNDDYLDVFVSDMDPEGQTRLWLNQRDGTFRDVTNEAGLKGLYGGLNCIQTDFNNDGHLDVFILRGGWMGDDGQHPNSLLRNNGDGTFTDITYDSGLGEQYYPTQTASWADFDGDGDLDLFVGNELSLQITAPCQLFRNNGDETFTDVAREARVTNDRFAKGVIWGDYNHDGRPDIYVSNLDADNRLYHNNGDGTFTDVAPKLGVTKPYDGFPAWFWDFDNDGSLDLYVSSYVASAGHLAADALGGKTKVPTQRLYRGDGGGGFQDVTERARLDDVNAPMGANFGDLDGDGFLDFYLGTGRPEYWELMPNVMYRNRGGVDFANVTTAGGFGSLQKGHGIAFADIDHDGDQDVFSQLGGAYPGDKYYNALYENPGFGSHFLTVKLVGVKSNRAAIGARIRAEIIEAGQVRSVYRHVNSGGSFGANPLRQTLGLGKAEKIARLEIFWPTTGVTQTFTDIPLNAAVRITEDEKRWEPIQVDRFTIGGASAEGNSTAAKMPSAR